MRIAWIACALACLLARPAEAQRARPSEADLKSAFVVHVRDMGLLQFPIDEVLTLRQLDARLGKAAAAFDPKAAEEKRNSNLPLIVEVEPDAPWYHVQVVLQVAAQRGLLRIWLARKRGNGVEYLNAWLAGGASATYIKTDEGLVDVGVSRFPIYLIPRVPVARPWNSEKGTTNPLQPTAVAFGSDGEVGPAMEATAKATVFAARSRMENALRPVVGIVAAPPSMPSRLVLDAFTVFESPLFARVGFLEAPLPAKSEWDRARLAFPAFVVTPENKVRVIGGDPEVAFAAALRVPESHVIPAESDEVQPMPGFKLRDASVRMPLAAGLATDKGPWDGDRLVINLTRRGQLRMRGNQFSLRAMGSFVSGLKAARVFAGTRRPIRILLRIDGDAPWRHVQILLTELHRSKVERVEIGIRGAATADDSARDAARFDVLHRKDESAGQQHDGFFELLLDEWAGTRRGRSTELVSSQVNRSELRIDAEGEVETEWGPADERGTVHRPVRVRYEWNAVEYFSIREVTRGIVSARATTFNRGSLFSTRKNRVVVSASEKVPAKYPIAALARLSALKWGEIWYFRPTHASAEAFESAFLPYPKSDELLEVRDGLEGSVSAPGGERKRR